LKSLKGLKIEVMGQQDILDILRSAFVTALQLAVPLLAVSLSVGLLVSIFQAATQIQEQTLTFVPKVIIIGITLVVLAPWMMTTISDFVQTHFENLLNFM
jgi:flagellar biosynthetic protein FliQ